MSLFVDLETCFEVEDIGHPKTDSIHEHQVAANENVGVVRRRRWEHCFQFTWAGLHFLLQAGWQRTVHH